MSFWIFTGSIKHLISLTGIDVFFSQILLSGKFLKMPVTPPCTPSGIAFTTRCKLESELKSTLKP